MVLSTPDGNDVSDLSLALLMNAARAEHVVKVIAPALKRGEAVICDRFFDSTRVYQSVSGEVPIRTLDRLSGIAVGRFVPDLTLILDADPADMLKRRVDRGEVDDRFERAGQPFHDAVRKGFLDLAKAYPGRCYVVDASRSANEVEQIALRVLEDRLGLVL